MTLPHLSDEQVADYLSGISLPATASHLAQCAKCRDEVDRMSVSIRSFDQASMAWSEAQAPAVKPSSPRSARPWYGMVGVACALVVACALLLAIFRRSARIMEVVKDRASYAGESTAEIESDNQLLGAIDGELDSTGLSPERMYGGSSSREESNGGSENRLRQTP
jgi:hypothetical protein